MRKFDKGFIQIPLLIVIVVSILTVSTGVGIFLYKKGELPFISKKDNVIQPTPSSSSIPIEESQLEVLGTSEPENEAEQVLIPYPFSDDTSLSKLTPTPTPNSYPTFTPTVIQPTSSSLPTPTLTPQPTIYVNPEIEEKLAELRQTLEYIQNQPIAMNVIVGKQQRAYQDWVKNNPEIYSTILGSRYINDLNAILTTYGL